MPSHYFAFVLDEKSRSEILARVGRFFEKTIAHHVTIEFNPTDGVADKFPQDSDVRVIGYARGENIECVAVSVNGKTERADGSFYHVTVSLRPPAKPVDSNKLKNEVVQVDDFKIFGKFEMVKK